MAPGVSTPDSAAGPAGWRVVVTADRAYFDRMSAVADADAAEVAFPAYCPERRFVLAGSEVLIGRHSRSRGIEPEIDLTGPPEDAGVSHAHALFVANPDGGWNIVDLRFGQRHLPQRRHRPVAPEPAGAAQCR